MHHLVRRAVFAVAGAGLGMAASLGLAASPSAAQTAPQPTQMSFLMTFTDLNASSQLGTGDQVDGHAWLTDDAGQNAGYSTLKCTITDRQDWLMHCLASHYLGDGELHFTFETEYEPSTGTISESDATLVDGTGAYENATGGTYLAQGADGQSYLWLHNLWIRPSA